MYCSDLLLAHPIFRLLLPLISPSCKRRSFIHNIAHRPQHALLVCLFCDIVIGTDNVEFAIRHFLEHVIRNLSARPRAIGLLLVCARNVARLDLLVMNKEGKWRHTRPVNVQPGTRRCTPTFVSFRSKLRCSARAFTAALLALYAAFPGGFVMPCLLPVITIAEDSFEERAWKDGT
jgi:hypothetical protein